MKCTLVALVFAENLRTFLLNYIARYGTLSSIYPSERTAHLAALIVLTGRMAWENKRCFERYCLLQKKIIFLEGKDNE